MASLDITYNVSAERTTKYFSDAASGVKSWMKHGCPLKNCSYEEFHRLPANERLGHSFTSTGVLLGDQYWKASQHFYIYIYIHIHVL
jgi:hypothetical protein